MYRVSMTSFRMSVTVLAVMHALFAGFTALVGAFANGGDIWQRLLVVLLHPLGAAGVLVLVLRPRLVLLQGSVVEGGGLPTKGRLRSSVQLHQRASVRYVACLIHV